MTIEENDVEFSFARASGPGGQNVNKLNTKVTLYWNMGESQKVTTYIKDKFKEKFPRLMKGESTVIITSQVYRTQLQNKSECLKKLNDFIKVASHRDKRRVATRPTRGSVKRRLDSKKKDSKTKNNRKKVDY